MTALEKLIYLQEYIAHHCQKYITDLQKDITRCQEYITRWPEEINDCQECITNWQEYVTKCQEAILEIQNEMQELLEDPILESEWIMYRLTGGIK